MLLRPDQNRVGTSFESGRTGSCEGGRNFDDLCYVLAKGMTLGMEGVPVPTVAGV